MKANTQTLLALKSMFQNEQGQYDLKEMIPEMIDETRLIRPLVGEFSLDADECEIKWGEDSICVLSDFVDAYSQIFLEKVCNMIDSFAGENIDDYLESEQYLKSDHYAESDPYENYVEDDPYANYQYESEEK